MPSKGKFVKLEYTLLESVSWNQLSVFAQATYIIMRKHRWKTGVRLDKIEFGYADMPKTSMSKGRWQKSMKELIAYGFLDKKQAGQFHNRKTLYEFSEWWAYNSIMD